jgi:uncharacterized membrane protein
VAEENDQSTSAPQRALAGLSLGVILIATLVTLGLGVAMKSACASGDWSDGRQYRQLCYTDIVPLYGTEHLSDGRLPFLNPCPTGESSQCDEYPVLTMYFMRTAAWMSKSFAGYFYVNVLLLSICALATSWLLYRIVGDRALYFALAPTLLIYAFVNWDLLAVVLATVAVLLYLRNRDAWSGVMLGLGAAAKFYPGFLLVPFVLGRLRERRRGGAMTLVVWTAVAYGAVNLPFVVAARHAWATFFRFNSDRVVDWDSMWFVVCQRLHGGTGCSWSPHLIDAVSLLAFIAVAVVVWEVRRRRDPGFAAWTFGFPLLVAFLLTNKVYSPQYSLWLLPWFALALPNARLFAAFEVTDVAVFITRFSWFGRLSGTAGDAAFAGFGGVPLGGFQIALVVRAVVLVACLVTWALQTGEEEVDVGGAQPLKVPAAGQA